MRRLTIVLCLLTLLPPAASAGEPFAVKVEREPVNTAEPIYRAYVTVGEERFTFLIPEKYQTGGDSAHGRLTLINVNTGSLITFNFLDSTPGESPTPSPDAYREMLAGRYPGAKFTREFKRAALGRTGHVFEIEWKGQGDLAQKTRALYVPTSAGILELTATSGIKNFRATQALFDDFVGSITPGVNGSLAVHRLQGVN